MDSINFLGFIAATLTTASFLPQVIKSWKTKRTQDISLPAFLVLGSGQFLWATYGFVTNQPPILIANAITLALVLSILFLKKKHG